MKLKEHQFFNILFLIIFFIKECFPSVSENVANVLMIAYIVLVLMTRNMKIVLTKENEVLVKVFCAPWIWVMLYSVTVQTVAGMKNDYLTHSLFLCLRMVLYITFFYISVEYIGKKIVKQVLSVLFLSYLPNIVIFFVKYGFFTGLRILLSSDAGYMGLELEVHGISYIFEMIAIYYLFVWKFSNRGKQENFRLFMFSTFLVLIGLKRITYLSALVSFGLLFLLQKNRRSKSLFRAISTAMVFVPIVYLSCIRYGIFELVLKWLGVNSKDRIGYWNLYRSVYEMTPLFIGYGISFSHRVIRDADYIFGSYSKYITALHNDVLAVYLGTGFIGSLIYWYQFFVVKFKYLCKENFLAGAFALTLSIGFFINFMVSNCGLGYDIFGVYSLLIFVVIKQFPGDKGKRTLK